jgi:hypothetical protein
MPETVRAPPADEKPINVPDPRADTIDWTKECKRCQAECDFCKGWRELIEEVRAIGRG